MEILLAFAIGYAVGARAGNEGYTEVVEAARAVWRSEEFRDLGKALRSHGAATLRHAADLLSEHQEPVTADRIVDRVRTLIGSSGPPFRSSAS